MRITFPGAVADAAYTHVSEVLAPPVLQHSVRVWLLADHIGRPQGVDGLGREALAVACLFHDAGTADVYDGPQRFEVEGADAARAFLAEHDWPRPLVQSVWEAIALHTSPGIAERMGLLPRLVREGVLADFGHTDLIPPGDGEALKAALAAFPRMDVEAVLSGAVVAQALRQPEKAPPSSWPGGLLAAHRAGPEADPAF
ncbi:HD domain-containing protein [Streptomyces sp. NPDC101117]|uniref:HD domain-containing protein n=1 Tax=Streptomyces sp. NPDC101117 TaxID=3366108 RepID=UPI0038188870